MVKQAIGMVKQAIGMVKQAIGIVKQAIGMVKQAIGMVPVGDHFLDTPVRLRVQVPYHTVQLY